MSTNGSDAATGLRAIERLNIVPGSLATTSGIEVGLTQDEAAPRLAVLAQDEAAPLAEFEGETAEHGERVLLVGPCSARNAAALRALLPWLRPQPLGLRTSAGFGDRLGLATPGHIHALRAVGGEIAPIFAQQSIREMGRTGRSPQQVMDGALWGVFSEGWRGGFGADADHLKTAADIDACLSAGFTFFTIDPGDHVDDRALGAPPHALRAAFEQMPWADLEDTPAAMLQRYVDRSIAIDEHTIAFDELAALRAAVKYGRAVAHVMRMYRHLAQAAGGAAYELEVSVDETASPTTHAEHFYIASELRRLGVQWVSLAPRYVGAFEKGVDYIGDLDAFERNFAVHAAIARRCGPYKLSLHSGSDKFSIYPIAARQTAGLVHLKTAGTSYLEALRTIAQHDPALFREIYRFAREHYEDDRASYHVSANLDHAPLPEDVADAAVPGLLEQFDAREILHVTFGSVLTARTGAGAWRFRDRLMALLRANAGAYAANLESHFMRHLRPFVDAPLERGARSKNRTTPKTTPSTTWALSPDRCFAADPAQRAVARELYAAVKDLPLVCPHGHVNPALLTDPNAHLGTPAELFIIPDHYITRMLYSQSVPLEDLGVPTRDGTPVEIDHRRIWQRFAERFYLCRGTPTGLWLTDELINPFGVDERLNGESAQRIYDHLEAQIARPEFAPRALLDRFKIELLCTTDAATDTLEHHRRLHAEGLRQIRPAFRPDAVVNIGSPMWPAQIAALSEASGIDVVDYATFIRALEQRRGFFKQLGALATDHAAPTPYTARLNDREADAIVARALHGRASDDEAARFTAHMLMEFARMSVEDGLVMQLHVGSLRNHNAAIFARFGPDMGADIPIATEWTRNLQALLNAYGTNPRFRLILFTLDESTYSRELAPLAGHYPAVLLGPPWWFFDSINGMRRYFDRVVETAGLYNTAGFNDDTRAFASIPARHDVWRRVACDWLAGLVVQGLLAEDEAAEMAYECAYGLAKRAYGIPEQ